MKKSTNVICYEAPAVEVVEVAVEQGFAQSDNSTDAWQEQVW